VNQLLDYLEKNSLPQSIKWTSDNKVVASTFRLKLIGYEGGQHMVGIFGAENNNQLTKLLLAANADSRIAKLYGRFFDAWVKEGGDLFCHYASVDQWSKWGSWGTLQYSDDNPAQSPKFMAIMQWARSLGQRVNLPK
jgi:hypothetical protein